MDGSVAVATPGEPHDGALPPGPITRPERRYRSDILTRVLRIVTLMLPLTGAAVVALRFLSLSAESVQLGAPQDLQQSESWTSFVVVGVWMLLQILLVLLSLRPRYCYFPVPVTEANAQRLYQAAEQFLVWSGLGLAALFGGALFSLAGLPSGFWVILGVVSLAASLLGFMVRILGGNNADTASAEQSVTE